MNTVLEGVRIRKGFIHILGKWDMSSLLEGVRIRMGLGHILGQLDISGVLNENNMMQSSN